MRKIVAWHALSTRQKGSSSPTTLQKRWNESFNSLIGVAFFGMRPSESTGRIIIVITTDPVAFPASNFHSPFLNWGSILSKITASRKLSHVNVVSKLAAAYIAYNRVPPADLPTLITSLGASLDFILHTRSDRLFPLPSSPAEPQCDVWTSEIRRTITPETLISLLNGKPYKTLKRHLNAHGFDPVSYRAKFGLPNDYPMVAPSYSERRAEIAKGIGLGYRFRGRVISGIAVAARPSNALDGEARG